MKRRALRAPCKKCCTSGSVSEFVSHDPHAFQTSHDDYYRSVKCPKCLGKGHVYLEYLVSNERCVLCDGVGKTKHKTIRQKTRHGMFFGMLFRDRKYVTDIEHHYELLCNACLGSGFQLYTNEKYSEKCTKCTGGVNYISKTDLFGNSYTKKLKCQECNSGKIERYRYVLSPFIDDSEYYYKEFMM